MASRSDRKFKDQGGLWIQAVYEHSARVAYVHCPIPVSSRLLFKYQIKHNLNLANWYRDILQSRLLHHTWHIAVEFSTQIIVHTITRPPRKLLAVLNTHYAFPSPYSEKSLCSEFLSPVTAIIDVVERLRINIPDDRVVERRGMKRDGDGDRMEWKGY